MPKEKSPGRPTTRRYSDGEKADAVRLVRRLRKELGAEHGTVQRVAEQLGTASSRLGPGSAAPMPAMVSLDSMSGGSGSSSPRTRRWRRSCVRPGERTRS